MTQTKCRWCKTRLTSENHKDAEQGKKECFQCEKEGISKEFDSKVYVF